MLSRHFLCHLFSRSWNYGLPQVLKESGTHWFATSSWQRLICSYTVSIMALFPHVRNVHAGVKSRHKTLSFHQTKQRQQRREGARERPQAFILKKLYLRTRISVSVTNVRRKYQRVERVNGVFTLIWGFGQSEAQADTGRSCWMRTLLCGRLTGSSQCFWLLTLSPFLSSGQASFSFCKW